MIIPYSTFTKYSMSRLGHIQPHPIRFIISMTDELRLANKIEVTFNSPEEETLFIMRFL